MKHASECVCGVFPERINSPGFKQLHSMGRESWMKEKGKGRKPRRQAFPLSASLSLRHERPCLIGCLPQSRSTTVFVIAPLLNQGHANWLDWLASKHPGSTCSPPPGTRTTGICHPGFSLSVGGQSSSLGYPGTHEPFGSQLQTLDTLNINPKYFHVYCVFYMNKRKIRFHGLGL